MKEFIAQALAKKEIIVSQLDGPLKNDSFGLLHEPIRIFSARTNQGLIRLAVKTESLRYSPESLFRDLYMECARNVCSVHIEWFDLYNGYLSMKQMPQREYFFYNTVSQKISEFVPDVCFLSADDDMQTIAMEDLSLYINMNRIDAPQDWTVSYLQLALSDLARVHRTLSGTKIQTCHDYSYPEIKRFLQEFHFIATKGCGIEENTVVYGAGLEFANEIEFFDQILQKNETVIHNDFNIRNVCISPKTGHLKIFDWEFVDIGNPLTDIVDFLLSLDVEVINRNTIDALLSIYCSAYINTLPLEQAQRLLYYAAMKFAATRMNMYLLCYSRNAFAYIERMYKNLSTILSEYYLFK